MNRIECKHGIEDGVEDSECDNPAERAAFKFTASRFPHV